MCRTEEAENRPVRAPRSFPPLSFVVALVVLASTACVRRPSDGDTASKSAALDICASSPDGALCNDGNACTQGDHCAAGVCTGTVAPDGTACTDGNLCTNNDACLAGLCKGAVLPDGTAC